MSERYDFYDYQTKTKNPIRNWFHLKRQEIVNQQVHKYLNDGNHVIVDLGCGNAIWNKNHLPLTGIDISKQNLKYALDTGYISNYKIAFANNTKLKNESVDIVVCSEVIEHLQNPQETVIEINRILKHEGIFICTVPHDTILSFWKVLFNLQCFYQGGIKGSQYYKGKCGHINHFSPKSIKILLGRYFDILDQFSMRRFTIFTICRKR